MDQIGVVIVSYHTPYATLSCAKMYEHYSLIDKIVIVDNEATIESRELFSSISSSKIIIIFQEKNLGYSRGNNIGIKELLCDLNIKNIIISNSDVRVDEKSIAKCIFSLNSNEKIGAVAPIMKNSNGQEYPLRYFELGYFRIFLRCFFPEKTIDRITQSFCKSKNGLIYQSFLPGCFLLIKRAAIVDSNGYDENVFLYREEEILGKRLAQAGYEQAVVSDCTFFHNHMYERETPHVKINRNKYVMESERYFFKKYLKANKFQMGFVNMMHAIYLLIHSIGWITKYKLSIIKQVFSST